jgi:hypothetical protein
MYYPKNRILTNQYTSGDEYQYVDSKLPYTGYYWKTFNGILRTGKSPEDKPNLDLELIESLENSLSFDITEQTVNIELPYDGLSQFEDSQTQPYNENTVLKYMELKEIDINKPPTKIYPKSYHPFPTEEDYKNKEFIRYFLFKINSFNFIEVNKEFFDKIINKDSSVLWEIFVPFDIIWVLLDDENEMYKINKNLITLKENKLGKKGLINYFNNNFSQFHKKN